MQYIVSTSYGSFGPFDTQDAADLWGTKHHYGDYGIDLLKSANDARMQIDAKIQQLHEAVEKHRLEHRNYAADDALDQIYLLNWVLGIL